jgi:hypothetical protein
MVLTVAVKVALPVLSGQGLDRGVVAEEILAPRRPT